MRAGLPLALLAMLAAAGPAGAEAAMSEDEATHAAVDFLRGGNYGGNFYEVKAHLVETVRLPRLPPNCGRDARPVWAFHVKNPYDGWLYLDAATGAKLCSTLPYYR